MNIARWVERSADLQADRPAFIFEEGETSYKNFNRRIRCAAALLEQRFSIRQGDRVAFLGENSPDMLVLLFACARLGATFVPLNWRLALPEHLYVLKNSGSTVLFCERGFLEGINSIKDCLNDICITSLEDQFEVLLEEMVDEPGAMHDGGSTPLLIVYTSGTTGQPKGAVLTHDALVCNAENSISMHQMEPEDIIFTNLPMYHVGGLNIQTLPALSIGATVILHRRFDLEETVKVINESRPTLMILVPALMTALMQHRTWSELDFSSLRAITTGSTVVPVSLIDAYQGRGVPVIQVYGSTETSPIAIHQTIAESWTSRGSAGSPAPLCDAKIVDARGNTMGLEEKGEIVVRGANLFTGYWDDPDGTAEVLKDGWFYTGDIGHRDQSGWYFIDDRIKDVIISGSENIYPAELERILDLSSDLAESAVVGRSDKKWGEVPVVFVVPAEGVSVTHDVIQGLFDGKIARFKQPRDVIFVSKLPRNAMGKVLKFKLREMLC